MPQVNLPPGCRALNMQDGTTYRAAREGGTVNVTHNHAKAINAMPGNGEAGLVSAGFRVFGGTARAGRWCFNCQPARLWMPWSTLCPRCGEATTAE